MGWVDLLLPTFLFQFLKNKKRAFTLFLVLFCMNFMDVSSLGNKMFVFLKPGLIRDIPIIIGGFADLSHSLFG